MDSIGQIVTPRYSLNLRLQTRRTLGVCPIFVSLIEGLSRLRILCYGGSKSHAFQIHKSRQRSDVVRVYNRCAMKDAVESLPAERPLAQEDFANRKLIRPSLSRNDHNHGPQAMAGERRDRPERSERAERSDRGERNQGDRNGGKKGAPPDQTNAENFYYQKQMQSKTQMVVVLCDGEELHGVIEWYDKACIKLNRASGPNLMIYKPSIKYMYKEGENSRR
jgi:host factor-I protein